MIHHHLSHLFRRFEDPNDPRSLSSPASVHGLCHDYSLPHLFHGMHALYSGGLVAARKVCAAEVGFCALSDLWM